MRDDKEGLDKRDRSEEEIKYGEVNPIPTTTHPQTDARTLRCVSQLSKSALKMPSPRMGQKLERHTGPFP